MSIGVVASSRWKTFPTRYDGSTTALDRTAPLTGVVENNVGLFSCWFRIPAAMGTGFLFFGQSSHMMIKVESADDWLWFILRNSSSSNRVAIRTSVTWGDGLQPTTWHHVVASWTTGGTLRLYVDDASDIVSVSNLAGNINYDIQVSAGGVWTPSNVWDGDIAHLYFNMAETLDVSIEANRRKFISAGGKPVFLGNDGSKPTGSVPAVYLRHGPGANVGKNSGNGGDFTEVGTIAAGERGGEGVGLNQP